MSKVEKFEDLRIWKEGMELAKMVFNLFKDSKDFSLKQQIQKSALSIPSNIAEGYERSSNREFIRFLDIAKASCGEFRTQLYLCKELKTIPEDICDDMIIRSKNLSGMIHRFMESRKKYS